MVRHSRVLRRRQCASRLRRRTSNTKIQPNAFQSGFAGPVLIVLVAVILTGLFYLLTVNARAMQGQALRSAQERVTELQKEHTALRINAAELTSLYAIEAAQEGLQMDAPTEEETAFIDEGDETIALHAGDGDAVQEQPAEDES